MYFWHCISYDGQTYRKMNCIKRYITRELYRWQQKCYIRFYWQHSITIKCLEFLNSKLTEGPITVADQSKAWSLFARSKPDVMGLNLTRGIVVCVRLFFYVVLCGLETGWSPSKESYRLCIASRNEAKVQQKGSRAITVTWRKESIVQYCTENVKIDNHQV
jgi:hypothetical protein